MEQAGDQEWQVLEEITQVRAQVRRLTERVVGCSLRHDITHTALVAAVVALEDAHQRWRGGMGPVREQGVQGVGSA